MQLEIETTTTAPSCKAKALPELVHGPQYVNSLAETKLTNGFCRNHP
jgi:hypothetical protein